MGNEIEIHGIIFFDHSFERQVSENDFEIVCEYSANIELTLDCEILNEKKRFIIQVGGNNEEDFEAFRRQKKPPSLVLWISNILIYPP